MKVLQVLAISLFAIMLISSFAYAQGLGCINPTGADGDQYCNMMVPGAYFECSSGSWVPASCSNPGDYCFPSQLDPTKIVCQPSAPADCLGIPSLGIPDSYIGDRYCDPSNPNAYHYCTPSDWTMMTCPDPTDTCLQSSSNTISCIPASTDCTSPTGVEGAQYCNMMVPGAYFECSSGSWVPASCSNPGEYCFTSQLDPTKIVCQSSAPVDCPAVFSPVGAVLRPGSYAGDQYCISGTPNAYDVCTPTGWNFGKACPDPTDICSQISSNKINCMPASLDCTTEGATRCVDATTEQTCFNGQWGLDVSCIYNCNPTLQKCNPVPGRCTDGDETCSGTTIGVCLSGFWFFDSDCADVNMICKQTGNQAYCEAATTDSGSTSSSGSSGTGGTASGGGEVVACQSYSDWFVDSTSKYFDYGADGKQRECKNSILKRWCIKSNGQYDYSKYDSREESDCADWSEACEFIFDRTSSFVDQSGEKCRECTKEVYVEQCQPSGQINYGKTQETDSCGKWVQCSQIPAYADLTGTPAGSKPGGDTQSLELQKIMDDYGIILGGLIVALILVVAYTAWKMFSSEPEA